MTLEVAANGAELAIDGAQVAGVGADDANADDAWRSFRAGTSRTPFRAILEGRREKELAKERENWQRLSGVMSRILEPSEGSGNA